MENRGRVEWIDFIINIYSIGNDKVRKGRVLYQFSYNGTWTESTKIKDTVTAMSIGLYTSLAMISVASPLYLAVDLQSGDYHKSQIKHSISLFCRILGGTLSLLIQVLIHFWMLFSPFGPLGVFQNRKSGKLLNERVPARLQPDYTLVMSLLSYRYHIPEYDIVSNNDGISTLWNQHKL